MKTLTAQIAKFVAVGGVATLSHVTVGLGLHAFVDASAMTANLIAFVCATLVSCAGNWIWTFEQRTPLEKAVPRFFALAIFCLCLNQTIVFLMTDIGGISYGLALIPIVTLVPALSFWLNRTRVFVNVGDST